MPKAGETKVQENRPTVRTIVGQKGQEVITGLEARREMKAGEKDSTVISTVVVLIATTTISSPYLA